MTYCVNLSCPYPHNADTATSCQHCGSDLLLDNRYRPMNIIGQGGFGRTLVAIDENTISKQNVLIKQFIPPNSSPNSNNQRGIRQNSVIIRGANAVQNIPDVYKKELANLEKLKGHPQIPTLLSYFSQNNILYLVQDFFDGVDLAHEVEQQGNFDEDKIWQLLSNLLPVLDFIHNKKVIHLDIKPENIIRCSDNKLALVDFGAAKLLTNQGSITRTSMARATANTGTIGYMPPEQNMGMPTFASDLYSLGLTCICLMTRQPPEVLFDPQTHSWDYQKYLNKGISKKLRTILNKLIEQALNERYKSASEVLKDINLNKIPKQQKSTSQNILVRKNLTLLEKIGVCTGIVGTIVAVLSFVVQIYNQKTTTEPIDQVKLSSKLGIDYTQLKKYLRDKNWQLADQETYEVMLKIVGQEAENKGYINADKLNSLSCQDIQTIDELWRKASNGEFGFSSQQLIYEKEGLNWQKMYITIGWGQIKNGNFTITIKREIDWNRRRLKYKTGMFPNYETPQAGHLPVTIDLVQGKFFPQFADICKF